MLLWDWPKQVTLTGLCHTVVQRRFGGTKDKERTWSVHFNESWAGLWPIYVRRLSISFTSVRYMCPSEPCVPLNSNVFVNRACASPRPRAPAPLHLSTTATFHVRSSVHAPQRWVFLRSLQAQLLDLSESVAVLKRGSPARRMRHEQSCRSISHLLYYLRAGPVPVAMSRSVRRVKSQLHYTF